MTKQPFATPMCPFWWLRAVGVGEAVGTLWFRRALERSPLWIQESFAAVVQARRPLSEAWAPQGRNGSRRALLPAPASASVFPREAGKSAGRGVGAHAAVWDLGKPQFLAR